MGWTGLHREKGMTDKAFFQSQYPNLDFKACGTVNGVFYAAVSRRDPLALDTKEEIWALVIKIDRIPDRGNPHYNFHYKDMDETALPYYFDAPTSVLDALTPLGEGLSETARERATEWRETCRKHLKATKRKVGMKVEFDKPLDFGQFGKHTRFVIEDVKKGHVRALSENGQPYFWKGKILARNWRESAWHEITGTAVQNG